MDTHAENQKEGLDTYAVNHKEDLDTYAANHEEGLDAHAVNYKEAEEIRYGAGRSPRCFKYSGKKCIQQSKRGVIYRRRLGKRGTMCKAGK